MPATTVAITASRVENQIYRPSGKSAPHCLRFISREKCNQFFFPSFYKQGFYVHFKAVVRQLQCLTNWAVYIRNCRYMAAGTRQSELLSSSCLCQRFDFRLWEATTGRRAGYGFSLAATPPPPTFPFRHVVPNFGRMRVSKTWKKPWTWSAVPRKGKVCIEKADRSKGIMC